MTLIEAGPMIGRLQVPGAKTDMAGFHVGGQYHLLGLGPVDLAPRASYDYLKSTDDASVYRHNGDLDLMASGSLLGILTPYATAGVSFDKSDAIAYSGKDSWQVGPAVGAGVEIVVVPKLLHVTPSLRYVAAKDWETLTATLDAQVHLATFAVGARAAYEDNRSRSGHAVTGTLYAALRF